jgi:flavorubredoxin
MKRYAVPELVSGVYAVGSRHWNRRLFDALAPTPIGTTYNSYLVTGADRCALIDTILPGFEGDLCGKLDQVLAGRKIEYVIMNHAEPDHAGSIPHVLERYGATLVASAKGAELAKVFYKVAPERIRVVKDGETIALGGKTLRFINAPFLHWPETIFTYLEEDRILFSCDFFGAHNTTGVFDDEAEDVISWAKRYYAEIMMPLAKMSRMGMEKIKGLPITVIAPSHGPVYRHPEPILAEYAKWTAGATRAKVMIAYVSMYHTVEGMAQVFAETLQDRGVEVHLFDLAVTPLGDLAGQIMDCRGLVLATPTVLNALHPLAGFAALAVKTFKPPVKYGVVMNSYGWGKGAVRQGLDFLEEMKIEAVGSVEVNGTPGPDDLTTIQSVANQLADKVLADGK